MAFKIDTIDSRVNTKFETIYKCPNCGRYHLLWGTSECKHCKTKLKW